MARTIHKIHPGQRHQYMCWMAALEGQNEGKDKTWIVPDFLIIFSRIFGAIVLNLKVLWPPSLCPNDGFLFVM